MYDSPEVDLPKTSLRVQVLVIYHQGRWRPVPVRWLIAADLSDLAVSRKLGYNQTDKTFKLAVDTMLGVFMEVEEKVGRN